MWTWNHRDSMRVEAVAAGRLIAVLTKDAAGMWTLRSEPKAQGLWGTVRRNANYRYPHTLTPAAAVEWADRLLQFDAKEASRNAA